MTRHSVFPRARGRWVATFLSVAISTSLGAQEIDRTAAGMRVRATVCTGANHDARETRTGELLWRDTSTIGLTARDGQEVIPLSRALGLELRTRRSRELQGAGILVGIATGLSVLRLTVQGSDNVGLIGLIPVAGLAGGVVGYYVGSKLSGREEWEPMALPPGHGRACTG